MEKIVTIYTDGGCRDNQNPDKSKVVGGWGVVMECGAKKKEMYGGKKGYTTNNEMELTALLTALRTLKRFDLPTTIYIDSQYTINIVTKWMDGWSAKGWRKKDNKPIANKELIEAIYPLYKKLTDVKVLWVKGHEDNPGNIRADELANMGMDAVCKQSQLATPFIFESK